MSDGLQPVAAAKPIYRGMDRAALDAAYNNSAAVADSADWLAPARERSAAVRAEANARLDIAYAKRPRTRLDYFPSGAARAPLFVFIHGGYWQRNEKETFAFVADGPRAHGIDVALPGYTLAPDVRLTDIVAEIRAALSGLAERAGIPISGIFDLEPIALNYLNEKLRLDANETASLSPLRVLPGRMAPLRLFVGGDELPELKRQSADYSEAARARGLPVTLTVLPAHHHFSILDEICRPDGAITRALVDMAATRA